MMYSQGGKKACGFKFKYPNQHELYPEVSRYLRQHADAVRMIHLRRENLLKAAVSKQNQLKLFQQTKWENLPIESGMEMARMELDIPQAIRHMEKRVQREEEYRDHYSHLTKKYALTYEDLCARTDEVLNEVFSFLGVAECHSFKVKTRKITNDRLSEAITNYDELVTSLRGTPYERFLDA